MRETEHIRSIEREREGESKAIAVVVAAGVCVKREMGPNMKTRLLCVA